MLLFPDISLQKILGWKWFAQNVWDDTLRSAGMRSLTLRDKSMLRAHSFQES